jgi:KDO2-lipid IV(A) lauroyltransferase
LDPESEGDVTDLGYTFASFLVRRLSPRGMDRLLHAIADGYALAHPRRARAVDLNLARIWKDSEREGPPPRARETYLAFARALREFLETDDAEPRGGRVRLSETARRVLESARSEGMGAVLVSGHIGPWERALQWLAGELGGVEALAAHHRFAGVDRFFVERRARGGVRTLCSSRPVMSALQSLKAGGWIAALADRPRRDARRRSGPSGIVAIDRGPLLLARRAGALVIPGVSTFAADGALEIDFDAPFLLEPARGGLEVPEGLARLQRFFDGHVRAHPTQWFEWRVARGLSTSGW